MLQCENELKVLNSTGDIQGLDMGNGEGMSNAHMGRDSARARKWIIHKEDFQLCGR